MAKLIGVTAMRYLTGPEGLQFWDFIGNKGFLRRLFRELRGNGKGPLMVKADEVFRWCIQAG